MLSSQDDPIGNLNTAFEVAEKYLDIPKMLDAEGERDQPTHEGWGVPSQSIGSAAGRTDPMTDEQGTRHSEKSPRVTGSDLALTTSMTLGELLLLLGPWFPLL